MKKISTRLFLLISVLFLIFLTACHVQSENDPITIITAPLTSITNNSAVSGGNITNDQNDARIMVRGVCWDTARYPTVLKNKTVDGEGMWEFTSNITGLMPNTTYFVRAYATIRPYEVDPYYGTAYGNEIQFKTLP